jgi:hypothetical protein
MAEAEDELGRVRHVREAAGIDLQRETERGRVGPGRFPLPPSSVATDEAAGGFGGAGGPTAPLAPLAIAHSFLDVGVRGGGSGRMSVASEALSPSTTCGAPAGLASRGLPAAVVDVAHGGTYCAASLLEAARERPVSLLDVLLPVTRDARAPAGPRALLRGGAVV